MISPWTQIAQSQLLTAAGTQLGSPCRKMQLTEHVQHSQQLECSSRMGPAPPGSPARALSCSALLSYRHWRHDLISHHSAQAKHSKLRISPGTQGCCVSVSLGEAQHQFSEPSSCTGSGIQPEGQPEGLSAMQHFPPQSQVPANCRKPTSTARFFSFIKYAGFAK